MIRKEARYSMKKRFREASEFISRHGTLISLFLLFVITFTYFNWFGNGIFFYQENKSLFIYSYDYILKFLSRPGEPLVLSGNFLTQGYFSITFGSLVFSTLFTFLFLTIRSILKLVSKEINTELFLSLLLPLVLLICQAEYDYYIFQTLGYISAALWFRISISVKTKAFRIIHILLFPLFYYLTGTFAILYLVMYLLYHVLFRDEKERYLFPMIQLILGGITFLLFYRLVFLQPIEILLFYPIFINDLSSYSLLLVVACFIIVLIPLMIRLSDLINFKRFENLMSIGTILILFPTAILLLAIQNNPVLEGIMKTEKFFIERQADRLISHFEKSPSSNIVEQYYYNLALSKKDQLCNRMFFGRQSSGPMSLSLEGNKEQASRTMYYYYNIGLINEAHHLAFELMVRNGYTPENIKMLVRTELINNNFRAAERYLNVLKKTLRYRNWADKYERFLFNPELVRSDPEMGSKIRLMPEEDFFILTNENRNIDVFIKSNPGNKKVFEYKLARLLLEKDLIAVSDEVKNMKSKGYTSLPRHVDEAIIAYRYYSKAVPDLGGLYPDPETVKRFEAYIKLISRYNGNKSLIEQNISKKERNTFWYYLQFGTISGNFMKSTPIDRNIY
ncbi:MAG TPA: DUF6057 family protein [Bacteroidales bacterium]|nr:DUF6057 family protein [Bacteroidales bacterium]